MFLYDDVNLVSNQVLKVAVFKFPLEASTKVCGISPSSNALSQKVKRTCVWLRVVPQECLLDSRE